MMKKVFYGWILGAVIAGSVHAKGGPQWSSQMKKLSQLLSEILVDASSAERFAAPKNSKRIESNAKKLSELAHEIKEVTQGAGKEAAPDNDLSMGLISGLFKRETTRAYQEFKRGNKGYARTVLRSIPSYCIGCHTRSEAGPKFGDLISDSMVKDLKPFEKAEVFASANQYDKALKYFGEVIKNGSVAKERQVEWERAARYAVAIAVRVKNDPEKAMVFVKDVLETKSAPRFFKDDATIWKTSIENWEKERPKIPTSEHGLFAEGQRLMGLAVQTQKYPADRAGEVLYLRATQIFHDLLKRFPRTSKTPEALYMLGVAYRALQDLHLWSLSDLYFEACIRKAPHTPVSSECYRQFEESMFIGYSGSGGVSIPNDVKAKLTELESLSEGHVEQSPR